MKPYRVFKVDALPVVTEPDAVYYVRQGLTIVQYVTDENGVPLPLASDGGAGALLIVNQLSEFSDEPSKAAARDNLGLQNIDGGTFF